MEREKARLVAQNATELSSELRGLLDAVLNSAPRLPTPLRW